jgi:hypothetical protein
MAQSRDVERKAGQPRLDRVGGTKGFLMPALFSTPFEIGSGIRSVIDAIQADRADQVATEAPLLVLSLEAFAIRKDLGARSAPNPKSGAEEYGIDPDTVWRVRSLMAGAQDSFSAGARDRAIDFVW